MQKSFTGFLQIRLMLDIHSFKFSKILEGIIHDIVHVLGSSRCSKSFLLFIFITHHPFIGV